MNSAPQISIKGFGAVSPAGWGVSPLLGAITGTVPVAAAEIERRADFPACEVAVRRVPKPEAKLPFLRDPRLRRSSPVARHMAAAALEAIGDERAAAVRAGDFRLGVISTMLCGCVNYSRRFFSEVLADPATASPIVFPETVFNAPSSHLSALLGSPHVNYTLVGDAAEFVAGMDIAVEWLLDDTVDGVLVVAGEEFDWLSAEAFRLFAGPRGIVAEGGAAVYLEATREGAISLEQITGAHMFSKTVPREQALRQVRDDLGDCSGAAALFDSRCGSRGFDRDEDRVWRDWSGPRISVAETIGAGLGVGAAWQVVAACALLQSGACEEAVVSAAGWNEQCVAAKLRRRA